MYKACSKKARTFVTKTLFYNILSTVPFKVVPSTGDTPFPTFLPLFECFPERTFCDCAQFSYRIFLNLRVFKKRPNFLNSARTSIEGAPRILSATSGRFWQQTAISSVALWALVDQLQLLNWAHAQSVRRIIRRKDCARAQFSGCCSRLMLIAKRGKWQFDVKTCR